MDSHISSFDCNNQDVFVILSCAEADGALDKARKHKKRQLEDTLSLVLKKRKVPIIVIILRSLCYFNSLRGIAVNQSPRTSLPLLEHAVTSI